LAVERSCVGNARRGPRSGVNNIIKYHNYNAPNSTYNKTDPSSFGTFSGTRGSFSDIGTGRWHAILVFRLQW
jgi:hypothetical protein